MTKEWIEVKEPKTGQLVFTNKAMPPFERLGEQYYGGLGVIMYSSDRNKVLCNLCGKWYRALGQHVKSHGLTSRRYKEKFQIRLRDGLSGVETKAHFIAHGRRLVDTGAADPITARRNLRKRNKRGSYKSLPARNERGTCDSQLLERLRQLIDLLGRVPGRRELSAHGLGALAGSKRYDKFVLRLGLKVRTRRDESMSRRKPHCYRGHPKSGNNLGKDKNGKRFCKACAALRSRQSEQRRRAAAK